MGALTLKDLFHFSDEELPKVKMRFHVWKVAWILPSPII